MSAGEPINPEVMEQWRRKTGLDIYEGYGQTETVPAPLKTGLGVISQKNKCHVSNVSYDCWRDKESCV